MLCLAPSILACDFKRLGQDVADVAQAGASYIHIDVMDGAFVPSISFGMPVISSLRPATDALFDVHMMVAKPERYLEDMKRAGADIITVHQEACPHLDRTVAQIHELGLKAGVALNPATPISTLDCILPQLDMVLIMSVNPGFGGQKLIPYTLAKIKALRERIQELGLEIDIQVDGGVTTANVKDLITAGTNILVAGSSVFGGDAIANTKAFLKIFKEFE